MVVWTCPHCNHDFNPLEQELRWDKPDDVVLIDCPKCDEWMATQYADNWRKKVVKAAQAEAQ